MRQGLQAAVLVALVVLAACQGAADPPQAARPSEPSETPDPAETSEPSDEQAPIDERVAVPWALFGATLDGRTLAISIEPPNCEDVDELVLVEDTGRVRVTVPGTPLPESLGCTADSNPITGEVRLAEPLGDRELVGCDPPDDPRSCRDGSEARLGAAILIDGDLAVAAGHDEVGAWDAGTGEERWRLPTRHVVKLAGVDGGILVQDGGLQLLDRVDGAVLTEVDPHLVGHDVVVGTDTVIVRDRGDVRTLHALEPEDLSVRWTVELSDAESIGGMPVPLDGGRVAVQANKPEGGADLVILDEGGATEARMAMPDGVLLGGGSGALVMAGGDGRLRTLDEAGAVLTIAEPTPGHVRHVEGGLAFVQTPDGAQVVDVVTGAAFPTADTWSPWIAESELLLEFRDPLVLEARNARTGELAWRIDSSGSQAVGGCEPDQLLAQPAAVVAVRAADGCVAWWAPLSTGAQLSTRP